MAKKRKKRNSASKKIIIIASIAAINFTGISYASWNDNHQISTIIRTGNIDPVIADLDVETNDTVATLRFNIENKGTIPIKFVGYDLEGSSDKLKEIELNDLNDILNKHNEEDEEKLVLSPDAENKLFNEDCEIRIEAEKPEDPGVHEYEYKIKLLFEQWTD